MEKYIYTAIKKDGQEVRGSIDAATLNEALTKIKQKELYPVSINKASEADKKKSTSDGVNLNFWDKINFFNLGRRKIKQQDLVIFTRQLSVLLDAGLSLVRGLQTLKKQARFEMMATVIGNIIDMIESGRSFSNALAHYPESFSKVYINIVKAGETSGALDKVLKRLADYLERNLRLVQKIRSALVYPCLVLLVSLGILGFIVVFVIPRFMELFENTGVVLPFLTLVLMKISNVLLVYWYVVVGISTVVIIGYKLLLKNYSFRYFNDKIMLRLPVMGVLIQKITSARFSRTLATLLSGGVPILMALELTKQVCGNEVMAQAVNTIGENVREGGFISAVLENSEVFPELMINMIGVGEESGSLDRMLSKVADTYEEEVEITTNMLAALLEPLLVIIMGVVVGIIVLAMFLPLITLIQSLT
ncbi:MAG: type II secretion system F family protein [Candidatus Omnitrophota bacterium]